MGGKRRIFGLAVLLSVLLAVPLVFGLGLVDVSNFSLWSSSSTVESASTASVFVDPAQNITDYEDPVHNVTIGSTVTFHINVSGVMDLFTWQINMSWDPTILNVSRIIPSEFLARSDNLTSSEALGLVINSTDYAIGYSAFAETVLGDVSGINGSGRLVSIEFLIVGYGSTDLTIGVSGTLATGLLDSTGSSIAFTATGGYFSNRIISDIRGPVAPDYPPDGVVDGWDYGFIGLAFGKTSADADWDDYKIADIRGPVAPDYLPDGVVDGWDYGYCGLQFGRSIYD